MGFVKRDEGRLTWYINDKPINRVPSRYGIFNDVNASALILAIKPKKSQPPAIRYIHNMFMKIQWAVTTWVYSNKAGPCNDTAH